ncbi:MULTISPECIES: alpha/beta hydrolase [unclassified Bradyrhizobium]|uniref:alpha/beta fold hydrolase n=1 Tax=unclassified Bradyrhizobium TaxID=2631580 RepID=UPI001FFA75F8|nr:MULTISPECIES: alpha/beta hydrolase [unclassified Bradyrhizobium]
MDQSMSFWCRASSRTFDFQHELPGYTRFLRRLTKFARVVTFDKRGQGMSDRLADIPSLEERIDDVRAVMDAIGSKRAALIGFSEGIPHGAIWERACGRLCLLARVHRPTAGVDRRRRPRQI